MATYYFVYAVYVLQVTGKISEELMLLDHEEVFEIIENAKNSGGTVIEVSVSMYDESGECVNERNITHLLIQAN